MVDGGTGRQSQMRPTRRLDPAVPKLKDQRA